MRSKKNVKDILVRASHGRIWECPPLTPPALWMPHTVHGLLPPVTNAEALAEHGSGSFPEAPEPSVENARGSLASWPCCLHTTSWMFSGIWTPPQPMLFLSTQIETQGKRGLPASHFPALCKPLLRSPAFTGQLSRGSCRLGFEEAYLRIGSPYCKCPPTWMSQKAVPNYPGIGYRSILTKEKAHVTRKGWSCLSPGMVIGWKRILYNMDSKMHLLTLVSC